jgi:hypothetical protein
MVTELTRFASRAYLSNARLALEAGISSWVDFAEHMRFIVSSAALTDPVSQYAKRVLAVTDEDVHSDWALGEAEGSSDGKDTRPNADMRSASPDYRAFFRATVPHMSDWIFHPFDPDFRPSVPHGHWDGAPNPKLDVYLGWVYRNSQQIRREPRRNIIALWNDRDFRRFAKRTIEYYLKHHPHYSGWSVSQPLKLPRTRRR